MKSSLKSRRGTLIIAFLWAAGVAAVWWLTPVGPREGWQPPRNEFAIGFLQEGRTMVTVPRSTGDNRDPNPPVTGPVRLWNIDTGTLRSSHFGPEDIFEWVVVNQQLDMLLICQRSSGRREPPSPHVGPPDPPIPFSLRLYDPITPADIGRFDCRAHQDNVCWIFSEDGETTAFVNHDLPQSNVAVHEVRSGLMFGVFPDCYPPMCLSPDGRRLAARRENELVVFDVPSGREIAQLKPIGIDDRPKMFSGDGKLLLDSQCSVWEVDIGVQRFAVPFVEEEGSLFTSDGKALVVVEKSPSGSRLVYYDTAAGEEIRERGALLSTGHGMHLNRAVPDSSLMLAFGTVGHKSPSDIERWLSKLPYVTRIRGLQGLGEDHPINAFMLMETATGREIMRGNGLASCTPDGRFVLSGNLGDYYQLWDVQPRKPLRSLLGGVLAWSVALGLSVLFLAWFRRLGVAAMEEIKRRR